METLICEKMGWTYEQLQDTPQFFIERLLTRWGTEGEHQKEENKKLERKMHIKKVTG